MAAVAALAAAAPREDGEMKLLRTLKHLSAASRRVRRTLSDADLDEITAAIAQGEATHRGEIRVIIEGPLPWGVLWRDESCRQRAEQLFQSCGVSQTRDASGILLYIQLIERRVEILADRGIDACIAQSEWDALCRLMEGAFAAGDFKKGLLDAVDRMNFLLAAHFPTDARGNPDELENPPLIL